MGEVRIALTEQLQEVMVDGIKRVAESLQVIVVLDVCIYLAYKPYNAPLDG